MDTLIIFNRRLSVYRDRVSHRIASNYTASLRRYIAGTSYLPGCTKRPVFGLRCQFSEYRYQEFLGPGIPIGISRQSIGSASSYNFRNRRQYSSRLLGILSNFVWDGP